MYKKQKKVKSESPPSSSTSSRPDVDVAYIFSSSGAREERIKRPSHRFLSVKERQPYRVYRRLEPERRSDESFVNSPSCLWGKLSIGAGYLFFYLVIYFPVTVSLA